MPVKKVFGPRIPKKEEGAFDLVRFLRSPVANPLNDNEIDLLIARAAVAQFNEDSVNGFDHRVFVRAGSIVKARALVPIYQSLGLAVEAISSKLTKRQQDQIEERLRRGKLNGIACRGRLRFSKAKDCCTACPA